MLLVCNSAYTLWLVACPESAAIHIASLELLYLSVHPTPSRFGHLRITATDAIIRLLGGWTGLIAATVGNPSLIMMPRHPD